MLTAQENGAGCSAKNNADTATTEPIERGTTMTIISENTTARPMWDQWSREDFRRHLSLSPCRGMLRTPPNMATGTLGTTTWSRISPTGWEYLVVDVNTAATTSHHGSWGAEEAIAHMVLHVEEGTSCEGSEPTLWTDTERKHHQEAMDRMGWAAYKCDVSDDAGESVAWAGASV